MLIISRHRAFFNLILYRSAKFDFLAHALHLLMQRRELWQLTLKKH